MLDDPKAEQANLCPSSSAFWFVVAGIKRFMEVESGGMLPVTGTVRAVQHKTVFDLRYRSSRDTIMMYFPHSTFCCDDRSCLI